MGQERLSALTLMNVHNDIEINYDQIVDKFKQTGNRRIAL